MVRRVEFARFTPIVQGFESSIHEVPSGGFCLSVFLFVTPRDRPAETLWGRPEPSAEWELRAGYRAAGVSDREWLLPASILHFGESPDDAVERIIRHQLARSRVSLSRPQVVSEVYSPRGRPEWKDHWDLRFLYEGRMDGVPPAGPVWAELGFLGRAQLQSRRLGRGHGDVLRSRANVSP